MALHELSPHSGSLEELFMDWTSADTRHESNQPEREEVKL